MTSDVEVQPTAEPSSPSAPHEPSTWPVLRSLLLRLHFYAGILVAPFLLVAATTGLLYAASYQVEKVVYSHELTVPVPAGQARLPLSQQVATATAAHPEGTLGAVRTAAGPGDTTQVLLDVPGLAESTRLAVFVDPYTGEVRGPWRVTAAPARCRCEPGSPPSTVTCNWASRDVSTASWPPAGCGSSRSADCCCG
ncbi:PepSY-associated TM helix domain-containing protein [Streptosporangium lutulentum]